MTIKISSSIAHIPPPSHIAKATLNSAASFCYLSLWLLLEPVVLVVKIIQLVDKTLINPEDRTHKVISQKVKTLMKTGFIKIQSETMFTDFVNLLYEAKVEGNMSALIDILAILGKKNAKHIPDLLRGANLKFEGDNACLNDLWKALPGASPRISSHIALPGTGFHALSGGFLKELLFWVDPSGHTRCQFESSSFAGKFLSLNNILHASDYLLYAGTHNQQGPFGSSHYTESKPCIIKFNWISFQLNRIYLRQQLQFHLHKKPSMTSLCKIALGLSSVAMCYFTYQNRSLLTQF